MRIALSADSALYSSVSDISEGITNGQVAGDFGHMPRNPDYWNYPHNLESETIAHFNEAQILGGDRFKVLHQAFPQALSYYNHILKKRGGELK